MQRRIIRMCWILFTGIVTTAVFSVSAVYGEVNVGSKGEEIKQDPSLAAPADAIEAWRDMKLGLFICWGPCSIKGVNIGWSRGKHIPAAEYDNLYKQFNPVKFDADEWVQITKDMGANYMIFLTKHHDGFCLWDTKETKYNIMKTPYAKDVTGQLAKACKKAGVGFMPYYSICDWYHPDFPRTGPYGKHGRKEHNLERYTEFVEAQCGELVTRYGPLLGIWFDFSQDQFDVERNNRVMRHLRGLQKNLIFNSRCNIYGDFDTPERHIGGFSRKRPWETCIPLGRQWSWKPREKLKSWQNSVQMVVFCAIGDGNLALNTGPMPDGRIDPRQVEVFRNMGKWLKKYGESIYKTRGGPFVGPGGDAKSPYAGRKGAIGTPGGQWWGGSTHKGRDVYLHIIKWPTEKLVLDDIGLKIVSHKVLTGGTAEIKQADGKIEISVPADQRDPIDTIVKLTFNKSVEVVEPIITPSDPGKEKR